MVGSTPSSSAGGALSGLELLERLSALPVVQFHTSQGVYGEQVSMSLSETLEGWKGRQVLTVHKVSSQEQRRVYNQIQRCRPIPGQRDVGLIALALHRKATALLTHDTPAANAASHLRQVVVDLLDLGDLLVGSGHLEAERLEASFAPWSTAAWRPEDWRGGAGATLAGRPGRERLQRRLLEALGGETGG